MPSNITSKHLLKRQVMHFWKPKMTITSPTASINRLKPKRSRTNEGSVCQHHRGFHSKKIQSYSDRTWHRNHSPNTLAALTATELPSQCLGRCILTRHQSELLHKRSNSICCYWKPRQHLLGTNLCWTALSLHHKHISPHATCHQVFEQIFWGWVSHLRDKAHSFIRKHKATNVLLQPF